MYKRIATSTDNVNATNTTNDNDNGRDDVAPNSDTRASIPATTQPRRSAPAPLPDVPVYPRSGGRRVAWVTKTNDVDGARTSNYSGKRRRIIGVEDAQGDSDSCKPPRASMPPGFVATPPLPDVSFNPRSGGTYLPWARATVDWPDIPISIANVKLGTDSGAQDVQGDSDSRGPRRASTLPGFSATPPLPEVVFYPRSGGRRLAWATAKKDADDIRTESHTADIQVETSGTTSVVLAQGRQVAYGLIGVGRRPSVTRASPGECLRPDILSVGECRAPFQGLLANYKSTCFFNVISALVLHLLELSGDNDADCLTQPAMTLLAHVRRMSSLLSVGQPRGMKVSHDNYRQS